MKSFSMEYGNNLFYRSDFDKSSVINTFKYRGWILDDEDWNIYWASVGNVRNIFNPEHGYRLSDDQIINHFPNHIQLTRKDLMVKNIKRYSKEQKRYFETKNHKKKNHSSNSPKMKTVYDFVPDTYLLPADYSVFFEEFKRECLEKTGSFEEKATQKWIVKPIGKARGIGISIITKLSQVKKLCKEKKSYTFTNRDQQVVSKYLDDPFLIEGKKFDLRLYCLVTSYRPLKCYMFKQGFCRVCAYNYSNDNLDNMFVHLTNVAIQKQGKNYNAKHGNKWSLDNFLLYVEHLKGKKAVKRMMDEIKYIVLHSLKAVQSVMVNDRHCFEVYGYDIMLDSNLKPWLLETNASPSLSASTPSDRILKTKLIHDTYKIVVRDDFPNVLYKNYKYDDDHNDDLGDYYVLYDELNGIYGDYPEDLDNDMQKIKNQQKDSKKRHQAFRP